MNLSVTQGRVRTDTPAPLPTTRPEVELRSSVHSALPPANSILRAPQRKADLSRPRGGGVVLAQQQPRASSVTVDSLRGDLHSKNVAALKALSADTVATLVTEDPSLVHDIVRGLSRLADGTNHRDVLRSFHAARDVAKTFDEAIKQVTGDMLRGARGEPRPLNDEQKRAVAVARAIFEATKNPHRHELPRTVNDTKALSHFAIKYNHRRSYHPIHDSTLNSTVGISAANRPASVRHALRRATRLVRAIRPDIADEMQRSLDENDYVLKKSEFIMAAWVTFTQDMELHDMFWGLTDDEKATVLIHEWVHAQSEFNPRRLFSKLGSLLPVVKIPNVNEYIAYLHQLSAVHALGIPENDDFMWAVYDTKHYHFELPRDRVQLFKDLDDEGFGSSESDYAALRSLARVFTTQEKRAALNYLLSDSNSSGQKQLIFDMLRDTPRAERQTLMTPSVTRTLRRRLGATKVRQLQR